MCLQHELVMVDHERDGRALWHGAGDEAGGARDTRETCPLLPGPNFALLHGEMDFDVVIRRLAAELEAAGIRYALIGGFAMALRGVQRATVDLDFILMLEDLGKTHLILGSLGYERVFRSENVSHYLSPDRQWGRIDILHAFRGPTLGMLKRAEKLTVLDDVLLPVVQIEDIIGLKIQAAVNAPERATRDWSDIRMMLETAASQLRTIDWELVADYLAIFNLQAKLPELRSWYGQAR